MACMPRSWSFARHATTDKTRASRSLVRSELLAQFPRSQFQVTDFGDHDHAPFAHEVAAALVGLEIESDPFAGGNCHSFVDNRSPHLCVAADLHAFKEH